MATVEEIREDIKDQVDDGSFSDELIDRLINRAIRKTSETVLFPLLETSDTADTEVGNPYLDQPSGFGHNLFHASTATGGPIKVLSSLSQLLEEFPMFGSDNLVGDIEFCCLSGNKVAIHPVPAAVTTVRLFYHEWPAVLDEGDDVCVYIPGEEAQEAIIHNYVLAKLHKRIEDGAEGALSNTAFHEGKFLEAVKALALATKQGQSRPTPHRKSWGI